MGEVRLLDCTLRDGGYLNDWDFGHDNIVNIFERLVSAHIDIVEVGFIDDRRKYDVNRSIFPDVNSIRNSYGQLEKGKSLIVGMIDYGTCSIENVQPCTESYIDGIRVIFKREKMHEAISFCAQIKEKGYQVFVQAVSITSYDSESFRELINLVNELQPFAFSLVDTYGLLHKKDLNFYFQMANKWLNPQIGLGYHAHNNFQLAYSNCVEVLETKIDRLLIIDGTLYGMGKSAGNAPIELLVQYMNEHAQTEYKISQLLEAIDVTIAELRNQTPWGYNLKFFLSASNDCHPNYVTFLQDKGKLSIKSINEILKSIEPKHKLHYEESYIEQLYLDYQKLVCNDSEALSYLRQAFMGKKILLLAPGKNVYEQKKKVEAYIKSQNPIVIAVNFLPKDYSVDYVFVSNAKRYVQLSTALSQTSKIQVIATSNITRAHKEFDYILNYGNLLDEKALIVDNPLFMLLRLLPKDNEESIALAGFDGYQVAKTSNYINANMEYIFTKEKAEEINADVRKGIERIGMKDKIEFITKTYY